MVDPEHVKRSQGAQQQDGMPQALCWAATTLHIAAASGHQGYACTTCMVSLMSRQIAAPFMEYAACMAASSWCQTLPPPHPPPSPSSSMCGQLDEQTECSSFHGMCSLRGSVLLVPDPSHTPPPLPPFPIPSMYSHSHSLTHTHACTQCQYMTVQLAGLKMGSSSRVCVLVEGHFAPASCHTGDST